jgi:metal-responsive CopG/Arc/MetJ family transcriptional regulator
MSQKNNLVRITVDLPTDLQKKIKMIAALQGKSMREVIIEAIEQELQANKNTTQQSLKNLDL